MSYEYLRASDVCIHAFITLSCLCLFALRCHVGICLHSTYVLCVVMSVLICSAMHFSVRFISAMTSYLCLQLSTLDSNTSASIRQATFVFVRFVYIRMPSLMYVCHIHMLPKRFQTLKCTYCRSTKLRIKPFRQYKNNKALYVGMCCLLDKDCVLNHFQGQETKSGIRF